MITAPIHTFGLNNMMTKDYSRKDIGKITKPEPTAAPPLIKYMSFDITPERGDMAAVRKYFAQQEAVERWGYQPPALPKRKTTDELMREFLMKSIQQEDHRRAMREAEEGMPFYGIMASQEEKQRMATQALAEKAVKREGAKRRIVSWMSSPQMISRVKAIAEPMVVTDLTDDEFKHPPLVVPFAESDPEQRAD